MALFHFLAALLGMKVGALLLQEGKKAKGERALPGAPC